MDKFKNFFIFAKLNNKYCLLFKKEQFKFGFDEIPWSELAFPTVHNVLEDYIAEVQSGAFTVEMIDIDDNYWRKMLAAT